MSKIFDTVKARVGVFDGVQVVKIDPLDWEDEAYALARHLGANHNEWMVLKIIVGPQLVPAIAIKWVHIL